MPLMKLIMRMSTLAPTCWFSIIGISYLPFFLQKTIILSGFPCQHNPYLGNQVPSTFIEKPAWCHLYNNIVVSVELVSNLLIGIIMTSWPYIIIYIYSDKGNRYSQELVSKLLRQYTIGKRYIVKGWSKYYHFGFN